MKYPDYVETLPTDLPSGVWVVDDHGRAARACGPVAQVVRAHA